MVESFAQALEGGQEDVCGVQLSPVKLQDIIQDDNDQHRTNLPWNEVGAARIAPLDK
jgi:hypothetical protein